MTFFILRNMLRSRAAACARTVGMALLAAGTPAWAATYYLSPGGNDTNAGTSGAPWQTLAKANSMLQPGDVVLIQSGSYSGGIVPARDGGASSRITYIGQLSSPGSIVVASIDLSGRSYVSVKGVTSTGSVNLNASQSGVAARYDSLLYVSAQSDLSMCGAWNSHVGHSSIGTGDVTDKLRIDLGGDASHLTITRYSSIEDNVFNLGGVTGGAMISLAHMRECTFSRNTVVATAPSGDADTHFFMNYRVKNCTFTDNNFTYKNYGSGDLYGLYLRDSSRYNVFVRDTFTVHPSSTRAMVVQFAASGAYNDWLTAGDGLGSCAYNEWYNCYFKADGAIHATYKIHGYKFVGNTFITKDPTSFWADSLTMRHNTFLIVNGVSAIDVENTAITNSTIRSNIFYAALPNTGYGTLMIPDVASVRSDSNLIYSPQQSAARACYVRTTQSACKVGPGCSWCDTYGKDCHSQWGDPLFTSVAWATADATPRTGSIALSAGLWPDGYVGAINPGGSVGDLTPPGAVGDLALALISDHTIVLRWTATGDDGTTGQASAYDLRWSNQPITTENFAAATPVGIQPVPALGGTPQSYVQSDLTPSTSYYFALRVVDESGNWSDLSNVLAVTTKATDTVPPAPTTLGGP